MGEWVSVVESYNEISAQREKPSALKIMAATRVEAVTKRGRNIEETSGDLRNFRDRDERDPR